MPKGFRVAFTTGMCAKLAVWSKLNFFAFHATSAEGENASLKLVVFILWRIISGRPSESVSDTQGGGG